METREAYNNWAGTYDTDINRTRDLEGESLRLVLKDLAVNNILEIGCGTGKNTDWLAMHCRNLQAVDFSESMLEVARKKNKHDHVQFTRADISQEWKFTSSDLIVCSLVLEHVADLDFIFRQAENNLNDNGIFYISELHPYKQLQGSRAKFEKEGEQIRLDYYVHHISDYFEVARLSSFQCMALKEFFDDEGHSLPRLVTYLFRKIKLNDKKQS